MVWRCVLTSQICMWLSSFPNTTCWRDCLFSGVYSCLLCWRLIDCRCGGYFWALFCSIDPCLFLPILRCIDCCSFVVLSGKPGEGYASSFVLSPLGLLWKFWVCWLHSLSPVRCLGLSVSNTMSIFLTLIAHGPDTKQLLDFKEVNKLLN